MYEQRDFASVTEVENFIFDNGFEVLVNRNGPAASLHETCLKECDATLIYYRATDEDWLKYMILDLLRARQQRESRDFICKALFLAEPGVDYRTHVAEILRHDGTSLESSLTPFIQCLRGTASHGRLKG